MALPTRVQRGAGDPFEMAQREFDGMLNRWLGGRESSAGGNYLAPYAVDVREDQDHIFVEAELPGFKKEEVDITLENQTLTIAAERRADHQRNGLGQSGGRQSGTGQNSSVQNGVGGELLLHERRYTRFLRSFTLPPTVDEQGVNAKLTDGVLTITLKKREETKPRKFTVT